MNNLPPMTKVMSPAHFRAMLRDGATTFIIALAGGAAHSRKRITRTGFNRYRIYHGIDGTTQHLSFARLLAETNIGVAIKYGSFFAEVRPRVGRAQDFRHVAR